MTRTLLLSLVIAVASQLVRETRADACGGCVSPPNTFTAVDSHRMVIALGTNETILWDQFIYSGAPEEFAWILPVPSADVVVELAGPEFVQLIDAETAPRISPASPPPCDAAAAAAAGGCGCGGGFVGFPPGPVEGVEVYDQGVVGPYETVVVGSEDPNALFAWMAGNGYAYPQTAVPTLQHYIDQGSAFVILRLRPETQVSAMQPVRIRFRGFMGTFPLKMVVVGAGGTVDLSLWVIGDQRYAALNYPTVTVDEDELAWNWSTDSSNYDEVFAGTIDRNGGRAWITEYAAPLADSELAALLAQDAAADYAAVTAQLHYPYLTRLRTSMLVEHLDQDLQLALAADPTDVARDLVASRDIDYVCDEAGATGAAPTGGGGQWLWLVMLALVGYGATGTARKKSARIGSSRPSATRRTAARARSASPAACHARQAR